MKKKPAKNYNAQMIFVVLVLISSVLAVGMLFGVLTIKKLHTMSKIGESVKAYYAAETGIECELYKEIERKNIDCTSNTFRLDSEKKVSFTLSTSTKDENGKTYVIIQSVGYSKGVKRAIQVKFEKGE